MTSKNVNFAIEPNIFVKIGETLIGLDKKLLKDNSENFRDLIEDLNDDEHVIDLNDDSTIKLRAFNVVMMYYYTPWWCTFNLTQEHYSFIWEIVYICWKYNFTKLLDDLEKYLIEHCNLYFETLKIASFYKLKNLRKKCITNLCSNYIPDERMENIKEVTTDDLVSLIKQYNISNKPKK